MNTKELNPCKKCGCTDNITIYEKPSHSGYSVVCSRCNNETKSFKTKEEAIEAWNNPNSIYTFKIFIDDEVEVNGEGRFFDDVLKEALYYMDLYKDDGKVKLVFEEETIL